MFSELLFQIKKGLKFFVLFQKSSGQQKVVTKPFVARKLSLSGKALAAVVLVRR
jgi:hypothetical protein